MYASKLEKCLHLKAGYETPKARLNQIEGDNIWQTVITGSQDVEIGKLIQSLNNSDWVNAGRRFIKADSDVCPFCQKHTIDESFHKQIREFFDREYEVKINEIKKYENEYRENAQQIIQSLQAVLEMEQEMKIGKLDAEVFQMKIKFLQNVFEDNIQNIVLKQNEPGRKIELKNWDDEIDKLSAMIKRAKEKIDEHNSLVEHSDDAITELTNDIWKYCITEEKALIESYQKGQKGLTDGLKNIVKLKNEIRREIDILDKIIEEKSKIGCEKI